MALLTVKKVAPILGVKPSRAYHLARAGLLPCVRMGKNVRFDLTQVQEWIRSGGQGLPVAETASK